MNKISSEFFRVGARGLVLLHGKLNVFLSTACGLFSKVRWLMVRGAGGGVYLSVVGRSDDCREEDLKSLYIWTHNNL